VKTIISKAPQRTEGSDSYGCPITVGAIVVHQGNIVGRVIYASGDAIVYRILFAEEGFGAPGHTQSANAYELQLVVSGRKKKAA
jgi:hypothetical protein